ncbi:hypothetical protein TNCV_4432751 [Trichonephila clavipes]|nr:hypothetical protein TNCV_4432751 [Trichonephila clavipes]
MLAEVAECSRYRIVAGLVPSSSPEALKTRRVGVQCPLNLPRAQTSSCCCDSPVIKKSDHARHVMSTSTTKDHRVGQRCTLNHSRTETSSRWCGVVVRRGGTSSDVILVT